MKSNEDFFKGFMFGAVAGGIIALLYAPKSGEETREDIKKIAHDVGDKIESTYRKAKQRVQDQISDLKEAGSKIDIDAYKSIVASVVDELKEDKDITADAARKLRMQLNDDWDEVKNTLKRED
jgi:gas vesicle protein